MNEIMRPLLERVFNILRKKGVIPPLWIPRHDGRTFRTTGDSLDKIPAAYFEHMLDKDTEPITRCQATPYRTIEMIAGRNWFTLPYHRINYFYGSTINEYIPFYP